MKRAAWILLPLAYVLLLFRRLLWDPSQALLFRDVGSLTLPAKHVWAESLRRFGELPGWNPYVLGGAPFLADPSLATHHPLNLIFLLFPERLFAFAHTWYLAAHLPLIFAGFFLFFRLFSGREFFAALAALSLAGGGYAVSFFYMSGTLGAMLGGAWLFYFWLRFLKEGRVLFLFASSLFLGSPLYTGEPQAAFLLAVFFLPGLTFSQVAPRKGLAALLKLGVLTVLAVAPQFFPSFDLLLQSSRGSNNWISNGEMWSLHPARLLEWVTPLPFGWNFWANPSLSRWINAPEPIPFVFSIYAGFFLLPSMIAVFRKRLPRDTHYWALIALLLLLASFGSFSFVPLNHWLSRILPLWGSFRYPERLIFYAQLALLFWLAVALRGRADFFRRFGWASLGCLLAGGAAVLTVFPLGLPAFWLTAVGFGALALFILFYPRQVRFHAPALVGLTLVELSLGMSHLLWPVPAGIVSPAWPPFLQLLKKEEAVSLETSPRFLMLGEEKVQWGLLARLAEGKNMGAMEQLSIQQWLTFGANTSSYFGLSTPLGGATLMHRRQETFWDSVSAVSLERALSMKSTRYTGLISEAGDFSLRKNAAALPLFFSPDGVDAVATEIEALVKVSDAAWDWRHRIVVQGSEATAAAAGAETGMHVQARTFNRLEVKVTSKAARPEGWVLWNESYDRNWSAFAKGKELEVVKGNYWATALLLPSAAAGEEIVLTLQYQNPLIPIGRSFFAIWLLLGLLAWLRERRNKKAAA